MSLCAEDSVRRAATTRPPDSLSGVLSHFATDRSSSQTAERPGSKVKRLNGEPKFERPLSVGMVVQVVDCE